MPFSHVQNAHSFINSSSASPVIPSVTAGNALVFRVAFWQPTGGGTLTDDKGNTWTRHINAIGSGDGVQIWVATTVAAGTTTLAFGSYGDAAHWTIDEYTSDNPALITVDKTNSNIAAPVAGTHSSGSTGTLSTASQIALAVMTHNGNSPSLSVDTAGGWTNRWTDNDNDNRQCVSAADQVRSANTSVSHTWTIGSPTPGEGVAAILTLMEGGGGGGGGNPWYYNAQQRVRLERLWKRSGLLWQPSYALRAA